MVSIALSFISSILSNKYVLIGLALVSVYFYHIHTLHQLQVLETEKQQLIEDNNKLKNNIEFLKINYTKIVAAHSELSQEVTKITNRQKAEEEKLFRENRHKKSLEELAIKKTKWVQKLINNATQKAFDCFVLISNNKECA